MWKLNNMLLNNQWVTEEINEEVPNKQPKLTPKATRKGISKAQSYHKERDQRPEQK